MNAKTQERRILEPGNRTSIPGDGKAWKSAKSANQLPSAFECHSPTQKVFPSMHCKHTHLSSTFHGLNVTAVKNDAWKTRFSGHGRNGLHRRLTRNSRRHQGVRIYKRVSRVPQWLVRRRQTQNWFSSQHCKHTHLGSPFHGLVVRICEHKDARTTDS